MDPAALVIETVEQLEGALSSPSTRLVQAMRLIQGDIVILGVGGKMGPTLARMAKRASEGTGRRVIGVARSFERRFSQQLEWWGVEPVCCDLLDPEAVRRLPMPQTSFTWWA